MRQSEKESSWMHNSKEKRVREKNRQMTKKEK